MQRLVLGLPSLLMSDQMREQFADFLVRRRESISAENYPDHPPFVGEQGVILGRLPVEHCTLTDHEQTMMM